LLDGDGREQQGAIGLAKIVGGTDPELAAKYGM
jgi:hypothetical protein